MPHAPEPQSGRETRLLVLVVGVAIVVLLVLVQWRFPGSEFSVSAPTSAPLAGLAARATFDDLSNALGDVVTRVAPLTVAVPLMAASEEGAGAGETEPDNASDAAEEAEDTLKSTEPAAWGLAVRARGDVAVMYAPPGLVPAGGSGLELLAHDEERELFLLRDLQATSAATDLLPSSIRTFPGFTFVAALTGTAVGPSVQPIFIGRAESLADVRWSHALMPVEPGTHLTPGMLVFSLNSRFIGMVVGSDRPVVVAAPAIETLVQAIEAPQGEPQ